MLSTMSTWRCTPSDDPCTKRPAPTTRRARLMGSSRTPDAQGNPDPTGNLDTEKVGRRALLRRAATVAAAGIGGVAATEMLTAGPAAASTGAMQYGANNNAGVDTTTLTSSVDDATDGASTLI